jgi:putative hydrolase of the HAD superfamily
MIKTVICDLGGVYFTDGSGRAIERISAAYDITADRVSDVLMGDLGSRYRFGEISVAEFWDGAIQRWGLQISADEIAPIWLQAYEPIEGTVTLIDRLRVAGYEMLFLSDNVQDRVDYLEHTYGFLHRFKDGVFSHVVGLRKPDPKIYELALQKTSHPAECCVYIDDKPRMLEPARMLGMSTIAFESPDQVEQDLQSLGLTI